MQNLEDLYQHYLCREVPQHRVNYVCQDVLPTASWEEWYDIGRSWSVLMIMKEPLGTKEDFWIPDWIYRVRSTGKHFYLHMSNQHDYDLMDAFGIPHLNPNGKTIIHARGWEPEKSTHNGSQARL